MPRVAALLALAALAALLSGPAAGFYIPGIEPRNRRGGEAVAVSVNTLRSVSQLVPHDYYSLPFCQPEALAYKEEQIGQILWGDRIATSPYVLRVNQSVACTPLPCATGNAALVRKQLRPLVAAIEGDYRGYMSLDNLAAYNNNSLVFEGRCRALPPAQQNPSQRGYALGVPKSCTGRTMINNHLQFTVKLHRPMPGQDIVRIVGFTVKPFSIGFQSRDECALAVPEAFDPVSRQMARPLYADDVAKGGDVVWTYGVTFVEDATVVWASRWEAYLNTSFADTHASVHWVFIINVLLILLALAFLVATLLLRALHKDFARYNAAAAAIAALGDDGGPDEKGWKLVHADVFRPPQRVALLAMIIGNGVQLALLAASTIGLSLLGFLSPANRGALATMTLLLFVLLSFIGGYVTGRVLMLFDAKAWKAVFASAALGPGFAFVVYLFVDIVYWGADGANAAGPWTLMILVGLYLGVSVPLVVLGAGFAFNRPPPDLPVKVGRLAREVPVQPWWLSTPVLLLLPGIVPFTPLFFELKLIFQSVWQGMVYYVFGFLAITFVLWAAIVALTTVAVLYHQLCAEDYRWWWRSLLIPSGCGLQVFCFSFYYFCTALDVRSATGRVVFFAYTALFSLAYAAAAGAIGFMSAFALIRKMYSSIRID